MFFALYCVARRNRVIAVVSQQLVKLIGSTVAVSHSSSQSAIGCTFIDRPHAAVALAVVTVGLDFACVSQHIHGDVRVSLAMIMFASAVCLSDGHLKSLGIRVSPVQGWSQWILTSLKIGTAVAVFILLGLGSYRAMGYDINFPVTHPSQAPSRFMQMCLVAPTVEEAVYRLSACGLIAAVIGNKRTIAVNGLLFGFLHVLYGNPSPENLVGGFFLAWAFLKSETILIPMVLHSVGNLLVLLGQVGAWYMLGEAG